MTMAKVWTYIFIGTMLLTAIVGMALVSIQADGTAYALAMVFVLSAGGFATTSRPSAMARPGTATAE
jgi:hypothetical protein